MSAASIVTIVCGVLGACGSIAAVLVGLGRVLTRLDTISTEHTAARVESKAQHEETRREIASLREDRVRAEATAEHLRADVEALKIAIGELRADALVQTKARHDLRDEMQAIRAAVDALREDRSYASRSRGRG